MTLRCSGLYDSLKKLRRGFRHNPQRLEKERLHFIDPRAQIAGANAGDDHQLAFSCAAAEMVQHSRLARGHRAAVEKLNLDRNATIEGLFW